MVMTKDNLTVEIDAVCFYRVLDATKAGRFIDFSKISKVFKGFQRF